MHRNQNLTLVNWIVGIYHPPPSLTPPFRSVSKRLMGVCTTARWGRVPVDRD